MALEQDFDAIIGLGSNIGDKAGHVRQAIALLDGDDRISVVAKSKLYRTGAWGKEDQDWFVNACVGMTTSCTPSQLLQVCQHIETQLGRVRGTRWGPRTIDLDVLVFRGTEQADPVLTLPHPLITERAFVLTPLCDIAPGLMIKGRTVSSWLAGFDGQDVIEFTGTET